MDAENGDEVSESEDTCDEFLAIGNDHEQEPDGADENCLHEKKEGAEGQRSAPCASRPKEKCSCYSISRNTFTAVGALKMQCMLCGRVVNGSHTNLAKSNESIANPAGLEGPLFGVLPQQYAESLPLVLPDVSLEGLEDNSSEQDAHCSSESTSLVTGRSQGEQISVQKQDGRCNSSQATSLALMGRSQEEKIPVQNVCELFVQSPSPGMMVRIFLLERTHQERNEKWYLLYIIPEMERKVYESILKSYVDEETSQQGYKTRQIPFSVGNARSQEFHTVYVQQHITVSFEIENRWQENFVTQDARRTFSFSVLNIQCESKNRVTPGAKSHFRVEYVGEPGKLCQEQGKITLTIDSAIQSTLLFSISIWSSPQAPN